MEEISYGYVIENIGEGKYFALKERVETGVNAPIYESSSLEEVERYAEQIDIVVEAVGTFDEVAVAREYIQNSYERAM